MSFLRTIFALSTAPGRAAISVIRVSGPNANNALSKLLRLQSMPDVRKASLRTLFDHAGAPIDEALVTRFEAPHSFTGCDLVEFSVHGSVAVVRDLLNELAKVDALEPARAGEFSRQAFANGKLDLTELEGLADLVKADTTRQRQQALQQLKGALGALCSTWRREILRAVAHVDALIDFGDDERIDDGNLLRRGDDIYIYVGNRLDRCCRQLSVA
jgi:tRNA modification GTPase